MTMNPSSDGDADPPLTLAAKLTQECLAEIVASIQSQLYLDTDEAGRDFWNPDKEWSCCDVCQDIQDLLHGHRLVPSDRYPCP